MRHRWPRSRRVATMLVVALVVACTPEVRTDTQPVGDDAPVRGDAAAKPEVVLPEQAPGGMVVEELVVGDGEVVQPGDTVTVHLVVYALGTREEVDSTWQLAAPRRVPLVEGGAIEGVRRGLTGEGFDDVPGMLVGGRRQLTVPPDLAYGEAGAPPAIAPGETLVFVIDLLSIEERAEPGPSPSVDTE